MKHRLTALAAPFAVVGLVLLAGCTSIPGISGLFRAPSVTGDWLATSSGFEGTNNLTLLEDGDKLTGNYGLAIFMFPLKGTRTGNDLKWTVDVAFGDASRSLPVRGTLSQDGKKITGTFDATDSFTAIKKS